MELKSELKVGKCFNSLIYFSLINCCVAPLICRLTIFYQNFLFITLFISEIFLLKYWCKANYSYYVLRSRDWSFYYTNFIHCIKFIFSFHCRYNIFYILESIYVSHFSPMKNHISEHIFKTIFLQIFFNTSFLFTIDSMLK